MAGSQQGPPVPYCGPVPQREALWHSWNLDPVLLAVLAVILVAGLRTVPRRALFVTGWGLLVLVFVSPFCAMTTVFLAVRSLHHLAVFSVIAPVFAALLPWRAVPVPAGALAGAAALVAWHMPQIYQWAWEDALFYWLMQGVLLGSGWTVWSHILHPADTGFGRAAQDGLVVAGLAGVMGLIGAVLTFSPRVLFDQHLLGTMAWGGSALSDQQIAGLIMWVPGMGPFAVIAAIMGRRAWQAGQAA